MNKAVKILLIVAICLLGVGLLLAIWGWATTGRELASTIQERFDSGYTASESAGSGRDSAQSGSNKADNTQGRADNAQDTSGDVSASVSNNDARNGLQLSYNVTGSFSSVDIHTGVAKCTIQESTDGTVRVDTVGLLDNELELRIKEDKLVLRENLDEHWATNWLQNLTSGLSRTTLEIHIYLPSRVYDEFDLEVGVGECTVSFPIECNEFDLEAGVGDTRLQTITADEADIEVAVGRLVIDSAAFTKLDLEAGVGECTIQGLTVSKETEISGGVGSMQLKDAHLSNSVIQQGTGSMQIEGELLGRTRLKQGVGDCTLTLKGTPNDYYILFDKGVGDFSAYENGQKTHWMTEDDSDHYTLGATSAPNSLTVEGGVGSLKVNFN